MEQILESLEPEYRLPQASIFSGYTVSALRKKISRRELGYRKTGRIITIPESQLRLLRGKFIPPVTL